MILFRADANSSIGMGHVMRCLSIADAISTLPYPTILPRGKQDIKFVLADEGISDLIKSRGYEPIVLHTDYDAMDSEIPVWEELVPSIDADLIIVDSYFVTPTYLTYLREEVGRTCYIDDVLSFPYPADLLVNYNAYASLPNYNNLYAGCEQKPELILGVEYAPLRSSFIGVEGREQKTTVTDILLSTGGSDELHIALEFIKYLSNHKPDRITYHILLGAMNTDKETIKSLAAGMDNVVIHENVADMKSLICSMDLIISAAGSTLYEICACGVPLITFSTADNQVPGAEAFKKLGLAVNIGDLRDPESIAPSLVMSGTLASDAIERIFTSDNVLAADMEKRAEMSKQQRTVVDAHGASRLAKKLLDHVSANIRTVG